ncbi:MAG: hypothetical protein ACYSU1_02515 [Planctomycetota bacterium]
MNIFLSLLVVWLTTTGSLSAQKVPDKEDLQYDPYTRNDPEALEAAGYVTIGSMPWADGHTTRDIDGALGGAPIIWIETEHFRIGSSLPPYGIDSSDRLEVKKIRGELKRLRGILPRVPRKPSVLDPWLRVHLFAMRAEDLYDEISALLQVQDSDFRSSEAEDASFSERGTGPYLGMRNKFTLLLTEKNSTLARYGNTFCKREFVGPIMHNFPENEVLMFGLSTEMDNMGPDTTMHCMVVYGMTINLLNGYRSFGHSVPAWLSMGLAHWNARQIDETRNYFTAQRTFSADDKNIWDWEVRVRGRVKNDADPDFTAMTGWPDHGSLSFTDTMVSWGRVDYLRKERPKELAEFLRVVKAPFPVGVIPTVDIMKAHQVDAFQVVLGMDPEEFDAVWRAWVPKNYRKK